MRRSSNEVLRFHVNFSAFFDNLMLRVVVQQPEGGYGEPYFGAEPATSF